MEAAGFLLSASEKEADASICLLTTFNRSKLCLDKTKSHYVFPHHSAAQKTV